jgi:maltooligosyltrehalose trehalohydrolase
MLRSRGIDETSAGLLRWIGAERDDRLLLINTGHDLDIASLAEPLLAPPSGRRWQLALSTEAMSYGGSGVPPVTSERRLLPGDAGAPMVAVSLDGGDPGIHR